MGIRRKSKAEHRRPLNHIMTEMLPDILLFHILPKLPVKSLLRFRCVSKQWNSFITSPMFIKMQLHHATKYKLHQNCHKLLLYSTTTPYKFRIIDGENPKKNASRPLPFKVGPVVHMSLVTSLHGMVCVRIIKHCENDGEDINLILWNPLTGEYKMLSKAGSTHDKECYNGDGGLYGLYYSSSDEDYKILRVTNDSNVYIYSLKSDSWRKIESKVVVFRPRISIEWKPSALLNEKLYYLDSTEHPYSIIRFNTKKEEFTEMTTPFLPKVTTPFFSFLVIRGCIHLSMTIRFWTKPPCVQLWRMDGDGDWTKLVSSFPWCHPPLHLMRNGKWLVHSDCFNHLYQVDMKKDTEKRLCSLKNMEILPGGSYIETIVSPNQYIK